MSELDLTGGPGPGGDDRPDSLLATLPILVWEQKGEPGAASERPLEAAGGLLAELGYTRGWWLERSHAWLELIHPDDRETAEVIARAGAAAAIGWVQELRWMRADGRPIWVEANLVGRLGADGRIEGYGGFAVDITARRSMRRQLERIQRRYRLATEAANVHVWEMDVATGMVHLEPGFLDRLHMERAGFWSANDWLRVIHPLDRSRVLHHQSHALSAEADQDPEGRTILRPIEYRLRDGVGEYRWFSNSGLVFRDAEGRAVRVVGTTTEVTGRRRAELALRASNQRLDRRIREVADLSRKLIEAQETERARIAGELHDDVSQRLAWLSLSLGTLRHAAELTAPDLTEQIATMEERLRGVVGDLRTLSHRLHPLLLQRVGIESLLRDLCDDLETSSGCEVSRRIDTMPDGIPDDVSLGLFRIAQEATNNLIRHAEATHARIEFGVRHGAVELLVQDDGCGFDMAEAGETLGMTSMRDRMRAMGGNLRILSSPGRGTTVRARYSLSTEVTNPARARSR